MKPYHIITFFLGMLVAASSLRAETVERKILRAEEIIWNRFYSPKTNLFYDYLTSYEPGKGLNHLPTAREVAEQFPNDCGYGTGMEDCMISAGVMMTAVVNRYAVDHNAEAREKGAAIFAGIERCVSSVPGEGFVARGFSPFALNTFYKGSSRDQVTHAVVGMLEYYESPLPDEAMRERIRHAMKEVADRMFRNVTPENDYDFLRADGSRCPNGICKMENVMPHEAARLAMIYAVAWRMTGERGYYDLWREKMISAANQSLNPLESTTTYGILQMMVSLEILDEFEMDPIIKKSLREAATQAGRIVASRAGSVKNQATSLDLTELAPDWREVGGLVDPYRTVWYNIRESGEIALALLSDPNNDAFSEEQRNFLDDAILRIDFEKVSSCGVFDLLAAWWKNRNLHRE